MREAHAHIAAYGESLELVDLSACRSVGECLEVVGRPAGGKAAEHRSSRMANEGRHGGPTRWLRVTGARVEGWVEGRWPTLAELDGVTGTVPCVIMSFDHHAAVANSAAMDLAGLRAGVPVPPSGVVCVDRRGGATGLLLEQAAYAAWAAAPEPTAAERERHVRAALASLAGMGYREVHDLHSQDWLGPLLGRMERARELPVDEVWLYPPLARLREVMAGVDEWLAPRLRVAGAKVFVDGTINSRTALMLYDYVDPQPGMPRGKAMMTGAQLDEAFREVYQRMGPHGHLAAHAIGDGAVRMALDALERNLPASGVDGVRVRIEHCELIDAGDVPRFAELGVVCSVQPCHLLADIEALRRYLPHRLDRVLPLRELIDAGCVPGARTPISPHDRGPGGEIWFGSDVPIVRADPGDSIRAAVARRREGMGEDEAIGWGQRIGENEAWAAFRESSKPAEWRSGE